VNFWLIIAAMAAAAAAILLLAFVRKGPGIPARGAYDLTVYRDQLDEVAKDESRGTLTQDEAAAARLEIERRILGSDGQAVEPPPAPRSRAAKAALIAAAVLGPVAAIALYLDSGAPGMPSHPHAERGASGPETQTPPVDMAQIEGMVAKLAKRLEGEPDDLKGWSMLARSYLVLQRYGEAATAFAHAAALDPKNADLPASEGEALVMASDGIVTPPARDAFEAAHGLDPNEPRARFYLGLASLQAGEPKAALAAWEALASDAPKDAPWLPELNKQIEQVKESSDSAAKPAPGSSPEKPAPGGAGAEHPEDATPGGDAPKGAAP
jgi:cytochrome c-type biogenesis protein CcmH